MENTENKATEWGWVRYERTHWVVKGRKGYIGYFRKENDPMSWTQQRVFFLAHRPIWALRSICHSGKEPRTFQDQEIN